MIDRETIDRIFSAADIVEVINDYVTLKRKGVNYQACCPFHNEKTPSFVVSPAKGVFKCFGCGKAGNVVTFVMEHEQLTYPEALKVVAKKYGIEVREKELTEEELRRNDDRESMFILNSWAADYFAKYLHEDEEEGIPVGMSYFCQHRGFTRETIKKFGLGMCPSRNSKMTNDALKAGYKEQFLLATGLSIKSDDGSRIFDRFRERLIFPVHNISGRVVAFGGRTMRTDKNVAKYQNSPESEIYSKKNELYCLFFAKKAIQQNDYVIMVEGYADVISMHQSGIENVVASSGTSLTIEQVRLLRRFTNNITFIYDGDAAGQKAAVRGVDIVLAEDMNVRVVLLPEGEDPDTFARSHSVTEVQEYIAGNAENFITFKAKLLLKDASNDPIKRSAVVTDMVRSISLIPDDIKRSMFIKECSRLMDVDENLLISQVAANRLTKSGDREGAEFIKRQTRYIRDQRGAQNLAATASSEVSQRVGSNQVGSSVETLESDIIYFLVKH
ncbi:MAG: DNA primase, partial [Alistipes sp.]|nr:DNA primase [Alistipes sp.]